MTVPGRGVTVCLCDRYQDVVSSVCLCGRCQDVVSTVCLCGRYQDVVLTVCLCSGYQDVASTVYLCGRYQDVVSTVCLCGRCQDVVSTVCLCGRYQDVVSDVRTLGSPLTEGPRPRLQLVVSTPRVHLPALTAFLGGVGGAASSCRVTAAERVGMAPTTADTVRTCRPPDVSRSAWLQERWDKRLSRAL